MLGHRNKNGCGLGGGLYESIAGSLLNLANLGHDGGDGDGAANSNNLYSVCLGKGSSSSNSPEGADDAELGHEFLAYTLAKLGAAERIGGGGGEGGGGLLLNRASLENSSFSSSSAGGCPSNFHRLTSLNSSSSTVATKSNSSGCGADGDGKDDGQWVDIDEDDYEDSEDVARGGGGGRRMMERNVSFRR